MAETDQSLSSTSDDEEQLTVAQKARDTHARSRAEEEAAAQKLIAETEKSGGRQSKKDALKKKIWDTSRKRTVSNAEPVGPQKSKKAKASQRSDDDDMQVDTVPVRKPPAKRTSKSNPANAKAVKSKSKAETTPPTVSSKRKHLSRVVVESDEDSATEEQGKSRFPAASYFIYIPWPVNKGTSRSSTKISKAAGGVPTIPSKPQQKPTKITRDDDGSEIDNSGSQSDDEEMEEDQQSGNEGPVDLDAERSQIFPDDGATTDDHLNFSDSDVPKPSHHRQQSSSSSLVSMAPPPDTDYDDELNAVDGDATSLGMEDVEDVEPQPAPKQKKTAQQVKYEQEQPKIGASRVIHAQSVVKPKVSPESDWDPSARIVFPTTGGGIKLLEQTPLLKAVLADCIMLATYELAYKDGYQVMPARDAFMSRIICRVAKKKAGAVHIEKRAKKDMKFCQRLGPIVRGVVNDLRNGAISKVTTLYELNKAGITSSQIRSIVKQLFTDQRYILPYAAESSAPGIDTGDVAADDVTGDNVAVPKPPPKILKVFVTDKPFFAPIIIELIRETWWSSHKALGFKHLNDLKSNRKDRPTEVVLLDAMICLAGANAFAALQAWQTGVYIPAPEFSQGRLESTYKSLVAVVDEQCSKSPKIFNKLMHDLYLAVAKSPSGPSASGSANNVISLAIDSD
ncbi:hypothetical protein C8R44DRAFT_879677 [Mycena epipterygia]|nr:hypothetical protein C8R44DRAFT_879677 [Mycena epipterygia]